MNSVFKKAFLLFLVLALLAATAPFAGAAFTFDDTAAATLSELGLISADPDEWLSGEALTREEAAVMLTLAVGASALDPSMCAFSDVSAQNRGLIASAVQLGIAAGQPDGSFAGARAVSDRDFCTMLLRILGYSDKQGDFAWSNAPEFAAALGIGSGAVSSFSRADAAQLLYAALLTRTKDGGLKLIEKLCLSGTVTREALLKTPLSGYADCAKPVYDASEIFERCSAAVICLTTYEDIESLNAGKVYSTSSGFFIDPDGTALICYHQIEKSRIVRVKTADGHEYSLDSVLWYDTERDLAVIRLSKTDIYGRTVRAFPYIPLGDSDALAVGAKVFTISNPISLCYSLSDGIVSSVDRIDLEDEYPLIQFTAPISSGSSGGPLINSHAEAAGVVVAYYPSGNSLYLAVPINSVESIQYFSSPMSPDEIYTVESARKNSSTLTVDTAYLSLEVGESADVMVSHDCPGSVSISFSVEDNSIISCAWGSFETKNTVPITVTAKAPGETVVNIFYTDGYGNSDALAQIHVTVSE